MPQTLKISTPLKGVNRAFGREAQPPNTCFDALNVMPFDRYGRMRLSERTGLGVLSTLSNASPVRLLHIASSARSFSAGAVTLLNEPFTYANGDLGGQATWDTFDQNDTPQVNALKVLGNQVTAAAGDYTRAYALSTTAISLSGSNWDITMDVVFAGSAAGQFYQILLFVNFDSGAGISDTNLIRALFDLPRDNTPSFITLASQSASNTNFAGPSLPFSATHTIGLRKRGTTIAAMIDGSVVLSIVEPVALAHTGASTYGFSIDGNDPSLDPAVVDNFIVTTPGGAITNADRTIQQLVATAGADTFVGDPASMAKATASATYPIDANSIFVSAATLFGKTYIVDGTSIRMLDLADNTMKTYTASAGSAPTGCNIACNYRGRLILSGNSADPQNFFASALGDPTNWDYGAGLPSSAFAGNDSTSGRVGQPLHALIPMSDDLLVIGCEQSMWRMENDIAAGGSLVQITDFAGISSATAWTRAPDGSLYFVGPRGLFKMNPSATEVIEVSKLAYPQYFQSINRSTNFINLMYDADRYGIWIFLCPLTQGVAATSMFYDLRAEGFWPQDVANQLAAGPLSAIWWDGYSSDTRYPVLGGFAGGLYAFNSTNRSDNGGAINAYVFLGPIRPSDVEATLIGTTFNLGELGTADLATPSRWNSNFSLYAGTSAYDVTEGTARVTGAITWGVQGRTKTLRQRLRGEWFSVKVSNSATSNYFSFESMDLEFNTNGRNRRQGL